MRLAVFLLFLCSSVAFAQQPLDDTKPSLGLVLINTREAATAWADMKLPKRLAPTKGLMVGNIVVGSEAYKAGIRKLDLVEKVNNRPVRTVERIRELLDDKSPGDKVELQMRRLSDNGWFPVKLALQVGTERTAAYSQMSISGSVTTQTYQLEHVWFQGERTYLSPVIIAGAGEPSLVAEISLVSGGAIFPNKLTVRCGNESASMNLEALRNDTNLIDEGVQQTVRATLTDDLVKVLRKSGSKVFRCDGSTKFVEHEIDASDEAAMQVAFSVFDDMKATGNRDFTLGGRVAR
jgi:hypothetical protein